MQTPWKMRESCADKTSTTAASLVSITARRRMTAVGATFGPRSVVSAQCRRRELGGSPAVILRTTGSTSYRASTGSSSTPRAPRFGAALLFANNYFLANQNGYGLGTASWLSSSSCVTTRHNSRTTMLSGELRLNLTQPTTQRSRNQTGAKDQRVQRVRACGSKPGHHARQPAQEGVLAVRQMATRRFAERSRRPWAHLRCRL